MSAYQDRTIDAMDYIKAVAHDLRRRKVTRLGKQEELELIRLAQKGDLQARDRVVDSNILLALKLAKNYIYKSEFRDVADIMSCAYLGLVESIRQFDTTRGTVLRTIIGWYVSNAIRRSPYSVMSISVPATLTADIQAYYRAEIRTLGALGTTKPEAVIQYYKLEPSLVRKIQPALKLIRSPSLRVSRLKQQVTEEGRTESIFTAHDVDNDIEAFESTCRPDFFEYLMSKVNDLPPRDKMIIMYRFFNDHSRLMTYQEIGDELGLTKERIRQLLNRILNNLKDSFTVREAATAEIF